MVKILLDNGHGYDTPGKRSPIWPDGSQLFEWEFNRDIVSRIEILLKKAGISCVRLVPEKEDISLKEIQDSLPAEIKPLFQKLYFEAEKNEFDSRTRLLEIKN